MSEKKTSRGIIALLLVLVIIFAGIAVYYATRPPPAPPPPPEKPKVKVATIIPGSIQDGGWGTMAYLSTAEIARRFGVETSYSEWISVADAERIAREYIDAGYNVIIFHGGEYYAIGEKLAPQFPKVTFLVYGIKPLPYDNVWTVVYNWYKPYYAAGALMGMITKSKKIGFIGGIEFPSMIAIVNAIYLGAKEYAPDVKMYFGYPGSFDDPIKARQIAEVQIKEGVDVILAYVDLAIYGVVEAAKAAPYHVWLIGIDIDKYGVDPQRFVTTMIADFGELFTHVIENVIAGKTSGYVEIADYCHLAPMRGLVPKEIEDKAFEIERKVKTGEISVPEITDKYIVPPP
jgi:basic membrane protein A